MRAFQIVVLWLGGLGFLAFGAAFLFAPLSTFALAGIALSGPVAATELMAFYGGMELAVGGLIVACGLLPARRRDGLLLMAVVYAAIGLSRGAGMLTTGAASDFLWAALALELGLAALALIALRGRASSG
jgi:hypothetical protein